jgi:hypothetical protein
MSKLNDDLKTAINQYILSYNEMMSYLNKGQQFISVSNSSFTNNGREYPFYSSSEEECKKILNDSVKTSTMNIYEYIGSYNDDTTQQTRAIPTYVQNVKSVEQAKAIATEKGATVFGIQFGGQLFISTKDMKMALIDAKRFGTYKNNCNDDLGCAWMNQVYALKSGSFTGGVYYNSSEFNYVGSYADKEERAIPNYIGNISDKNQAIEKAGNNGATVFGIQSGGQLFINDGNKNDALAKATQYGETECNNPLGCAWTNQVYEFSGNNCFLYGSNNDIGNVTGSGTWVEGGTGTAMVNVENYYGEKLNLIIETIQTLIGQSDVEMQSEYNDLMQQLGTTNYVGYVDKITAQKKQLEIFAKENSLISEQNDISFEKLQNENMSFRIWVFILLFVLFIIFQLFQNPVLNSISYVCLFFMLSIIVVIIKTLAPLIFMILILITLVSVVLTLFYKKNYGVSIGILIVGSVIFALIYRL